jgi:hypothetical protein
MERAVKGDGRFCDILHVRNVLYLPLKRIGRKEEDGKGGERRRRILRYTAHPQRTVFTFETQLEKRSGKFSPKNTISSK